jgi:hypothetical protein
MLRATVSVPGDGPSISDHVWKVEEIVAELG